MSRAAAAPGSACYTRHRPEQTLLYQLVERHYPEFARLMAVQGSPPPGYVTREFEDYLKCGRLEHGFLRVRCESCHHEKLVAFSCKRRGFCPSCGARRMVDVAGKADAFGTRQRRHAREFQRVSVQFSTVQYITPPI